MTRKVYKYPLAVTDLQTIELPLFGQILDIQVQKGNLFLWALVNTSFTETSKRKIMILGTGHDISDENYLTHISTFQLYGGDLVFHAFEAT